MAECLFFANYKLAITSTSNINFGENMNLREKIANVGGTLFPGSEICHRKSNTVFTCL